MLVLIAYGCCCVLTAQEQEYVIAEQQIAFSYALKGTVKPAETTSIQNPVSWKPIKFIVPDGSYVKKDQLIAVFDPLYQDKHYEKMLIEKNVIDLELEERLLSIEDSTQNILNQIKEREERLRVLRASLKLLKSLPLKTDVTIAKGQLRVATLEREAADEEWTKAQQRYNKGFLSDTELNNFKQELARKQIQEKNKQVLLDEAMKKAPAWDVEIEEKQIENIELELKKLRFEQSKQTDFIAINKQSASRGAKNFERRLKRSKEEVEKLTVHAPIDGYIVYTDDFKQALAENGGKMWRRRIFVTIPHADGVYIQAVIPEHMRQMVNQDDLCDVYTKGSNAQRYQGYISKINNRPIDISAVDGDIGWGAEEKDSGIKVYLLEIKLKSEQVDLKPFTNVELQVRGTSQKAPTIPAQFVVSKDGKHYISINGTYKQVDGTPINAWFQLSDDELLGQRIGLKGVFPLEDEDDNVVADEEGQLVISGNITPVEERFLRVAEIHGRPKVVELVEDGSACKAGDVLLAMDDTETREELEKREEELRSRVSEREKAEEQLKITQLNGEISLSIAKNNVTIAENRLKKISNEKNIRSISNELMRHQLAQIELQLAKTAWDKKRALPSDRISKTELTQVERDYKRKQLQAEQAKINLYIAEHGVDYYGVKKSERDVLNARLTYESQQKRLAYDLEVANGNVLHAKNRENHAQERLDDIKEEMANLKLIAPVDGTVQLKFIWDGDFGKVKKGSTMRERFNPVSVADFSKCKVTLDVPEQAYPFIKSGDQVDIHIPALGKQTYKGLISGIDFTFKNKSRKDVQIGLYGNREPLGQSIFVAHVDLAVEASVAIKPGMQVHVRFPIEWPLAQAMAASGANSE